MARVITLVKESLNKSFDKALLSEVEGLRTNGISFISFVVSLSNHERNKLGQRFPKELLKWVKQAIRKANARTKSSQRKATFSKASKGSFLRWLRKMHGWVGLWGAALGLLFGLTGFLLNHKHVMQLPVAKMEQSQAELALPVPHPADANALALWLQTAVAIKQAPFKISSEPAKIITWGGHEVNQPALWKVDFHNPQHAITTEYWVGNHFVSVKRQEAGALDFITRLHKGLGMGVGWVLLADSLAGALMLLSITGVLLWTKMRGSRLVMVGLCGTSLGLAVLFTMQSM